MKKFTPRKKRTMPKYISNFSKTSKVYYPKGDAGFKKPWFKAVSALGCHYLGRVRYNKGTGYHPIKEWFSQASNKARYFGFLVIAKTNPIAHHTVLYKGPSKGRHKMTKTKKNRPAKLLKNIATLGKSRGSLSHLYLR
jgi:hypothetical protein